ncbi:hypothetical protein GCM10028801_31060 [Nocardioides maradonensis]
MTNDAFADARLVVLTGGVFYDSQDGGDFTREDPDEPTVAGGSWHTAWWSFTPTSDSTFYANTFGSYSLHDPTYGDTTLGIYTGSGLASLTTIASNDDIDPDVNPGALPNNSAVSFDGIAGTTYYIQIGTYGNDPTFYYLNIGDGAPPPPPPPTPGGFPTLSATGTSWAPRQTAASLPGPGHARFSRGW